MELLSAVQGARAIANFVEGGPLANELADLGIQAAQNAVSKASYAEDKKAQVWSAVNHLEQADAALSNTINRLGGAWRGARYARYDLLRQKQRYVLALMAICYRYLGEKNLADRTCQSIQKPDRKWRWWEYPMAVGTVPFTMLEILLVDEVLGAHEKYHYDTGAFVGRLDATWEEGPRELLSLREYGL